jgi:iron only hydrogenase large subunit-like protein
MGFDMIFNTGFATDLHIHELAQSVLRPTMEQIQKPVTPQPVRAWVKYAEQFMPELLPSISPLKGPQQIAGSLIKTYISQQTQAWQPSRYSAFQ